MNMMDATVGMLKAVISENRRLQNQVRNLSNGFENLGRGFENLGRGFENLNRNLSSGLEILTKKFEENSNIEFYKMIGIVIIAVCAVIIAGFIAGLYVKSVKGNENCPEKGRTGSSNHGNYWVTKSPARGL